MGASAAPAVVRYAGSGLPAEGGALADRGGAQAAAEMGWTGRRGHGTLRHNESLPLRQS